MMSRFTDKAQEALERAQQIMFARHHTQLDVEHIFLALLQARDGLPARVLTQLGGNVKSIIGQLETALNNKQNYSSGRQTSTGYITLRCNRVLHGSAEEADYLTAEYISVEHMLLAIATERDGVSGKILMEAGIDKEKIYAGLREIRPDFPEHIEPVPQHTTTPVRVIVNPPTLSEPRGFNHGILTTGGRTLYLAGQTALDAEGNIVAPDDIVAQYRQVLSNLQAVVEAAGGAMQNIVKITIFVKDRDGYKAHLKELGLVHKDFFGTYYPATALLEISRFYDDDALVEIEGIAVLGTGS